AGVPPAGRGAARWSVEPPGAGRRGSRAMTTFARTDTSVIGRWWWTVDRLTVAAVAILICLGVVLAFAASPAAGQRIGLDRCYLVRPHVALLPPAVAVMFGVSLLSPRGLRRVAVVTFLVFVALTALTPYIGQEIKGATRWLSVGGISLQPSEF